MENNNPQRDDQSSPRENEADQESQTRPILPAADEQTQLVFAQPMLSPHALTLLIQKASPGESFQKFTDFLESYDKRNKALEDKRQERQYQIESKKETTKRLGIAFVATALIAVLVHAGITKNNDLAEKLLIGTVAGISGVMYGKSQRDKD